MIKIVQSVLFLLPLLSFGGIEGFDWIRVISRVGGIVHSVENSRFFRSLSKIDFTSGGMYLSVPPHSQFSLHTETSVASASAKGIVKRYNTAQVAIPVEQSASSSLFALQQELDKFENSTTANMGLVKIHRLGAAALKKVPDSFLIGMISLIAAELLQREIIRQSFSFPPIFQAIANKTVVELDIKLQLLSALQWNLAPFLEYEIDNLQTQPIEIIDKYIIGEILFRIDRDLFPFLSKMIKDPILVKKIVAQVKAIVEIIAVAIAKSGTTPMKLGNSMGGIGGGGVGGRTRFAESLEMVVDGALQEWNKLIEDLGKLIKSESLIQYVVTANTTSLMKQQRLYGDDASQMQLAFQNATSEFVNIVNNNWKSTRLNAWNWLNSKPKG